MSTTQPEALRENYTAADMATAAAQGFRDGAASLAASAGSEPVAWGIFDSQGFYEAAHDQGSAERFCAHYNKRKGADPLKPYTASPLYTHPSPPEGAGWKWVPKILSAEMVDAWASARLPGGIAQMTDDEANRAVAQANWDSMIAAVPPPPAQAADSVLEDAARYRWLAAHCRSTSEHWGGRWSIVVDGPAPELENGEYLIDEAIDAAMAAARKQGANHEQG